MTDPHPLFDQIPIELPVVQDATQISCFRSCEQKWFLEFCCGLRPEGTSVDLHAGGAFAFAKEVVGREIFVNGRDLPDALLRAHAAFWTYWGDFEIPPGKRTSKQPDRVWAAVEEYYRRWPPRTDTILPHRTVDGNPTFEYTFAVPLEPCTPHESDNHYLTYDPDAHSGAFPLHPSGQPFIYGGRFDMLGEIGGRIRPLDDKTTTSIGDRWSEQWDLRGQFIGYQWACDECGLDVDGVRVRGIGILKEDIKTAEADKFYSDDLISRWHEQLRRTLWRIREQWDKRYFDYNFAEACTNYGNCIFMPMCVSRPEMVVNWANNFQVRRWNPLLKDPTAISKLAA